jgi:TolB-like protein
MRVLPRLLVFISVVMIFNALLLIPYANAGELDIKMGRMVKRMVKTINEKYHGMDNSTMAVFPFNADENLTKKKVDFAVTEILTQQFLKNSKLRLVERTQLEKILTEQKLGLSGAIDSETAARVGKLLGARLALLGGVSKLGKSYQISAKIVDSDTAEILSLDMEEISVSVFDEEASRYLTLVPETQAIGIYLSMGSASLQIIDVSPVTITGETLTPLNPQSTYTQVALGMKYYFYENSWFADVNYTLMGVVYSPDNFAYSKSGTSLGMDGKPLPGNNLGGKTGVNGGALKMMILHRLKIRDRWNGFLGGGIATTYFQNNFKPETLYDITDTEHLHPMPTMIEYELAGAGYGTEIIRAGVEYRPQARFGIGFFGNYYIQKYENTITQHIWAAGKEYKMEIYKFSMPQTYFEITTSLYF